MTFRNPAMLLRSGPRRPTKSGILETRNGSRDRGLRAFLAGMGVISFGRKGEFPVEEFPRSQPSSLLADDP